MDAIVELAVGSTGASVGIPGTVGLAPEQQVTKIKYEKLSFLIISIQADVLYYLYTKTYFG